MTRFLIAILAVCILPYAAHAQSSTTVKDVGVAASGESDAGAATSVARQNIDNAPDWYDHVYVNYFGIFHGPSVTGIDKPYTLNHDGSTPKTTYSDGSNDMNFDSELTTAWMVNNDWGIGLTTQFYAYPVQGYGITMGDFGLKTFDRNLVKTQNLRVYANLNVQLPFGYDAERNVSVKFKSTPYFRYDFSHSRFSVGAWNELAYYCGATFGNQYKVYTQPYVNYQMWSKFSWTFAFELETDHTATPRAGTYFQTSETDFMPGFTYAFDRHLILNPFLQVFTGPNIAMNRTGLGVNISASL